MGHKLRSYPAGFCERLLDCYEARGPVPPDMRHKNPVDNKKTDRELWQQMPMGDVWLDSEIHKVWFYLMGNRHLSIPDSWLESIMDFHQQLSKLDSWVKLYSLVIV